MAELRWQVHFTPLRLPELRNPRPFVQTLPPGGWTDWLTAAGIRPGTPILLSPEFSYDVELNEFFHSVGMQASAQNTQMGYARDIAAFLTFLWVARAKRSWRDAAEADHLAYAFWRRSDPDGPRVAASTWDREVAAVNRLYRWAVRQRCMAATPIPQTSRRPAPVSAGLVGRRSQDEQRPATYSHGARRHRLEWLTPSEYRRWRDIGVRGFTADGLPSSEFRGRWAARNAAFADLMVRTGLRLSEQTALTVFEVPTDRGVAGYQRFWLPASIAKGGSARWVYVPSSVIADLTTYASLDREAVSDVANPDRAKGLFVVEDPGRPMARRVGTDGVVRRVKVAELDAVERASLLVDGPQGLKPASFWLGEHGRPLTRHFWSKMFVDANSRCETQGIGLSAYPHLLRHTFAVVTLEQLQRGHVASLSDWTSEQRGHYTRVFGDPLDWVRRRLGHRSVVTTQLYLHALAELEMHTRMELVPDEWDDPSQLLTAEGDDVEQ